MEVHSFRLFFVFGVTKTFLSITLTLLGNQMKSVDSSNVGLTMDLEGRRMAIAGNS